ncbi:MAG: CDP-glucose 4,6-dehydratase [Bacteroidota bacterium]
MDTRTSGMEGLVNIFHSTYKGRRVLVTGHTGFKGSWLCQWLVELGAEVMGYALTPQTNPNHFDLLGLKIDSRIGDISDEATLKKTLYSFEPEIIFHLAAQPLVRYSYQNPIETYNTNVMGTLKLLDVCIELKSLSAVVCVTTDKVYENKEWDRPYKEEDRLGGYDPYSSSKACSEILVNSVRNSFFNVNDYGNTHNVLIATARGGNVVGGGDWSDDRLIPDIIRSIKDGQQLHIRNPKSTRPWQYVLDCLSGYLILGSRLFEGDISASSGWNFGPQESELTSVEQILKFAKNEFPELIYSLSSDSNPHEAGALQLDSNKAISNLGWQPLISDKEFFRITFDWYSKFYKNDEVISRQNILEYMDQLAQYDMNYSTNAS